VDILLRLQDPAAPGAGTQRALSVYQTDFEPEFLRRSGEFYEAEAGEVLERGDASVYLKNVSLFLFCKSFRG
jgi:cullin 3